MAATATEELHKRPIPRSDPNPLGTALFQYQGSTFYKTSRERRLVPGIVKRIIGGVSILRITSIEQTLLDTLHRPLSCGGPSVVYEAWQKGIARLNEARLTKYLQRADNVSLAQRVGYMLDSMSYEAAKPLRELLDDFLARLDRNAVESRQQLFPGIEHRTLHSKWLIYGP
jgi:hypothetical protein